MRPRGVAVGIRPHADLAAGVRPGPQPRCQTMWMCGAGIQGGQNIGSSDEVGYKAADQIIWNHDVHATLLHLLGMDHKKTHVLLQRPQHEAHRCRRRADTADCGPASGLTVNGSTALISLRSCVFEVFPLWQLRFSPLH